MNEIAVEQAFVDRVYERIEGLREDARAVARDGTQGETFMTAPFGAAAIRAAERFRGQAMLALASKRLEALDAAEEGLVFGRLDLDDGETFRIGRFGVPDEGYDPLVVDWRAPAASVFYRATPAEPLAVRRRRHILSRGRRVVGVDDDVLGAPIGKDVVGEAALLAALARPREGAMRDIVSTIQSEQDAIIRDALEGVLVVQGGPGTGKTAVALHRAAYLLYTHRAKLERYGVLVIGPNPVFLRYVERVIPSLGEQATLTTVAGLLPSLTVAGRDAGDAERVKGEARMADVIARAVRDYETPVARTMRVRIDGESVPVTRAASARMLQLVAGVPYRHNAKRTIVGWAVERHLAATWIHEAQASHGAGLRGPLTPGEAPDPDDVRSGVEDVLDVLWPLLTPERIVDEVLARELGRAPGTGWTDGDVALLDEAAAILGPVQRAQVETTDVADEELYYVDRILEDVAGVAEYQPGMMIDRYLLDDLRRMLVAARLDLEDDGVDLWRRETYGHVIVDEAQDVSSMQWRMLARRCPSGSMTVVGDLGQAGRAWSPASWQEVLTHLPRARVRELTINYRTPGPIARLADRLLADTSPGLRAPRSVREDGEEPLFKRTSPERLVDEVARLARAERRTLGEGSVAVVAPDTLVDGLRDRVGAARGVEVLGEPVAVLPVADVKGLEFDCVVVVEPASLAPRDLYVALTRSTRRLVVVHSERLPPALRRQSRQNVVTRTTTSAGGSSPEANARARSSSGK